MTNDRSNSRWPRWRVLYHLMGAIVGTALEVVALTAFPHLWLLPWLILCVWTLWHVLDLNRDAPKT